jgi:hypothetical protein
MCLEGREGLGDFETASELSAPPNRLFINLNI